MAAPLPSSNHRLENDNPFNPGKIFTVDGLVAVVTGGGTGIGLMIATALENNGATVYIVGRRKEVLENAAREHNRFDKIIPLVGDITKRESLTSLVDIVKVRHGYIDLLVNNAGIVRNLYFHPLPKPPHPCPIEPPSPPHSPSCDVPTNSIKAFQSALWDAGSPDDFADVFATNVTSVYYTTVAFLDLLHQGNIRKQKTPSGAPPYHTSQVLSISSSGAFRADPLILSMSYTLSKVASTHLGKVLANLLAPWGIRSNLLAPGVWPSEMTNTQMSEFKLDPSTMASSVPLKRAGTAEDMAGAILFLASRAGAYVNGSVFLVDGGRVSSLVSPI
ncbi:hypothetical protein C8J56DRAFT_999647 [Mycena floridula]|nr:hypothetical protein C8J56DRAFT_999647 [Mycena floridula]